MQWGDQPVTREQQSWRVELPNELSCDLYPGLFYLGEPLESTQCDIVCVVLLQSLLYLASDADFACDIVRWLSHSFQHNAVGGSGEDHKEERMGSAGGPGMSLHM